MNSSKEGVQRTVRLNYNTLIYLFFIVFSLSFVIPFILVLSVSFSSEEAIRSYGYSLIPNRFELTAYRFVFSNPEQIVNSYQVTAFQAAFGTLLSVLLMALCAYPLSRKDFSYRGPITFFIFFTMIFGGGLVPTYILITQYLSIDNTVWVYILPLLANAFHIIIMRTFFQQIPSSFRESAKIDGANELRIFFQIIVPISKPVLATISLLGVLERWNNWFTALIYIRRPELYSLQYLLQRILMQAEFVRAMAREMPGNIDLADMQVPTESMRFAMAVVAAGPMLVVFPFFQKYFVKGLTIGGVKG